MIIKKHTVTIIFLICLFGCSDSEYGVTQADRNEPITFYDLNWDMSVEQMESKLLSKGFVCSRIYASTITCKRNEKNSVVDINYDSNYVGFDCGVYNGCNYTIRETLKEFEQRFGEAEKLGGSYDWNSKLGDKLQLMRSSADPGLHVVILHRGKYGDKLDF